MLANIDYKRLESPLESSTGNSTFLLLNVSRRHKFLFISMCLVNFCGCSCFALMAPFFPIEAGKKGVPQSINGMIFGVLELVKIISSPIFGNYVSKIGSKFMFFSGAFVCGSCAILFGVLDKGPDGNIFIIMCFLCRSIQALGFSAYETAMFAILAYEFPDHVIIVLGTLESFTGLGLMMGPAIGGALYEIGGYGLPFFIMGALVIICGITAAILMPTIKEVSKLYSGSAVILLKNPTVVITCTSILCAMLTIGFMDSSLALHLKQFKLQTWAVGLMFFIAPGIYTLTAPVLGYICEKKGAVRLMIGLGNLTTVVTWLLIGPVPLFSFIPTKLYIIVIALLVQGLGIGCTLVPTFKSILIGASSLGLPYNLDTYGKVSGIYNCSSSLGAFIGATVGGYLVHKFTFPWACLFFAGCLAVAGSTMLIYKCAVPKILNCQENNAADNTAKSCNNS